MKALVRWRREHGFAFGASLRRVTGLTPLGGMLIGLCVVCWVAARLVGGRPLYLLAYVGLLVVAGAWAVSHRPLPVNAERCDTRGRLAAGESVAVSVSLEASRRVTSILLEDKVPLALGSSTPVPVASLAAGERIDHEYRLTCNRRGKFELGPLVAKVSDPFGLTEREVPLVDPVTVLVHPHIEPVQDQPLTRMFEDPPMRPPVSKPWPHGMEFYGMRDYSPGDDIRRVVWRAWARTGRILVRESEQGITDKLVLVLDQDRKHHDLGELPDDPSPTMEAAVVAAASLAAAHLREGYTVTLEGNERTLVSHVRGPASQIPVLDALAEVAQDTIPLAEALRRLLSRPPRDSYLIVITPYLDAPAAARLKLLVERGVSILVVGCTGSDGTGVLATAAALGCQVVSLRPGQQIAEAFAAELVGVRR